MDKQFVLFPKKKTNTWDNAKEDSPKYMTKFWLSKFWKLTKYLSSLPLTTSTDTDNNEVAWKRQSAVLHKGSEHAPKLN